MQNCSVELFNTLKGKLDDIQNKKKRSKKDKEKLISITEQLNECAVALSETLKFSPALDWLCAQGQCQRTNCTCQDKSGKSDIINILEYEHKRDTGEDLDLESFPDYDEMKPLIFRNPEQAQLVICEDKLYIPTKTEVKKALKPLNDMVGLESVKEQIEKIVKTEIVQKRRAAKNIDMHYATLHMVFSGNPGTGKTEVARIVADIFKELGILKSGHLIEVDRSDLVGAYVGHTESFVSDAIEKALDGVLFIDEAYALDDGDYNGYGDDALNVIVKSMEEHRKNLIVIAAGYKEEMGWLLKRNPGLQSRFAHHIDFPDYTTDEMVQIFEKFCTDRGFKIHDAVRDKVASGLKQMPPEYKDKFGNARGVRNVLEKCINEQSMRLYDQNIKAKKHLMTLLPEDIVFDYNVKNKSVSYLKEVE